MGTSWHWRSRAGRWAMAGESVISVPDSSASITTSSSLA